MARPSKAVVDYFPHFVNHGKTMFTVESKFGNDGYAFWFKILEQLGSSEHHFINCNDVETWEFLLAKTRFSDEDANNILDLLSKIGSINSDLWRKKIIRSDNFIQNLSTVYNRREIKVITNDVVMGLCIHKPPLEDIIDNINPQSIVKERRVKESIVEKSIESTALILILGSQKNIKLTQTELDSLELDFPDEYVEAIEFLSLWLEEKGDKNKSKTHNLTIRRWVIDAIKEKHAKKGIADGIVNGIATKQTGRKDSPKRDNAGFRDESELLPLYEESA